ncbi:MAG: pilus assembly protein TadG-related protein [Bryobacteraceae bacterium]
MLNRGADKSERGQALLLFALFLPVMLGMLALVIDAGWSYFVKKTAQTAADAAAMAAAADALQRIGSEDSAPCEKLTCQTAVPCPASGNLQIGCAYASANGFAPGGSQSVQIASGAGPNAPNVPNVPVDYWVQVTAKQSLPQWFSGAVSATGLTPAARATAALRKTNLNASLYLLNRTDDCFVSALNIGLVCGEDFLALGSNRVIAPGGIYMASSNASGIGLPKIAAGTVIGALDVEAPFTYLLGKGGIQTLGSTNWNSQPVNGFPDGDDFNDPMAGKLQPPAPTGLPDHPVPGGVIAGGLFASNAVILPPGNYYAVTPSLPLVRSVPTGLPVVVIGHVIFSDGQGTPCGGFCNYVFYGGLVTGALSDVTFSPGRYVFAGAQPVAGGPGVGLTAGANATIKDRTPLVNGAAGPPNDAGEIFIFTGSDYPGLVVPVDLREAGISFPQARAGLLGALNPSITLHGLNRNHSSLPAELLPYAPVLIWQDRANTTLKFLADGKLDRTCGGPCSNILSAPGSQEMIIAASQHGGHAGTNLYGTIYGPRGSWLTLVGLLPGDTVAGPMQIITGALQMTLNARLDAQLLEPAPVRWRAFLIQ